MKKTRKILLMAACAVLLVCISVGATVAYLTSTDSVTNTFTVGKVAITLDEAKVDMYGDAVTPAARTNKNAYKLIPGHKYTKDPTVHFAAGSEASYLFVKVENDIADIEDVYPYAEGKSGTIAQQIVANGWTLLSGYTNIYYKEVDANTTTNNRDYPVFAGFKVKGDADVEALAPIVSIGPNGENVDVPRKVTVTAYAIQADSFEDAAAAWTTGGFN